jgi:hypothetical protein
MSDEAREHTITSLRQATADGLFPLVAYSLEGDRLGLLTSNIRDLSQAISVLKTVTKKEYNLGKYIFFDRIKKIAEHNPHLFKLHVSTIEGMGEIEKSSLGRLISVFGAPYFKEKAFALVDICGFTQMTYSKQLASLYSIERLFFQSRYRSRIFCDHLSVGANFGRSSTGDGYYIWSNFLGGNADVSLFMLLLCLLERAENITLGEKPFEIKASFVIDSAFHLYETGENIQQYPQPVNAVGAATNGAARLISKAKPRQLLVNKFDRPGMAGETLTPGSLIRQANELFRLEGYGAADLKLEPEELLKVVDKHGDTWYCYNIYGKIPTDDTECQSEIGLRLDSAKDITDLSFKA